MAVRIGISRAAAWREMGGGVALLMRPATSIEHAAAARAAREKVQAAVAGRDVYAAVGLKAATPAELSDPYWLIGVTEWLLAAELAARIVTDWRGVEDAATGEAAALSPEGLADLFRYEPIQRRFIAVASSVTEAVEAEGKKSPPPRDGSAAGAAPTAGPVMTTTSRAAVAKSGGAG